ncbi:MAG TPA: 5-(carboxyamino)imidazole ribonucleotide mutase [Firmicutes bacterium]|jgi:5-(carboxyamino)imidazole ribonucleotide mutase|nr:5-(carboxyamino)imidazole ribonucleotide mutase [Bacillota bacterium]HOQ24077.1 5-(carboxyamino)imidazole ribonucleotide mutase [Bacillota bacterium]HPT67519.1 5-(carboxyamino)imidazole ribonucleotide mutase [Bacillota bacterium]
MAKVGIIMGSDSDLAIMAKAADVLAEFGLEAEMKILSAHRCPEEAAAYAKTAAERGIDVIIAGAGLAAHLPGVLAAYTTLPVIGVPLQAGPLAGQDALYAIVQMPPGVPVATVGIDGAKNAGLLAVQILATQDKALRDKLAAYKEKQRAEVLNKSEKLAAVGYRQYLKDKAEK